MLGQGHDLGLGFSGISQHTNRTTDWKQKVTTADKTNSFGRARSTEGPDRREFSAREGIFLRLLLQKP